METITQANRLLEISTPLGRDELLLIGLRGSEGVSELFRFELELLAAKNKDIPFDKLLGQAVLIRVSQPGGKKRLFAGVVSRLSQGKRTDTFTQYRAEVVPQLWLLTRKVQSRIFQHQTVPDILKAVLKGLNVSWEIQGTFHPRDYCVQYRESDFAFASRLMEEEGVFYFFKHSAAGSQMVVANKPGSHPDVPEHPVAVYEAIKGGNKGELRVTSWEKHQEIRSGKVTLWDHCFELPARHLEADKAIQESVTVGTVTHLLKVAGNDALEIYDYPGGYAQRFDGVDKGGGPKAADLQKIFEDNKRTAELRAQREAAASLGVVGEGNCYFFTAGHKFSLEKHFNADGEYVLARVEHDIQLGADFKAGQGEKLVIKNRFTCLPVSLPYRPERRTPRPQVLGSQTATVVGPAGEEIFTDKYGRIKVQFHWDREGKYNADSSCWIRVATTWAGKGYGNINIPRVGQEVVVDFLEGDPDNPIVIGSVYNAEQMPPTELPKHKMHSGARSNSTPGGGGFNGLISDDTKGKEHVTVHAQYDLSTTAEHDETHTVHNNRTVTVDGTHTETIKKDTKITITQGAYRHAVSANTADYLVKGKLTEVCDDEQQTTVTKNVTLVSSSGNIDEHAPAGEFHLSSGKVFTVQSDGDAVKIQAAKEITLTVGASSIVMKADGTITISGDKVTVFGSTEAKMGVGKNSVTCETSQVVTSGTSINSTATGKHVISGALVKIN